MNEAVNEAVNEVRSEATQVTAQPAQSAAATFAAIDAERRRLIGDGLLTISRYDSTRSRLTRIWSSNPDAYPAGGSKDKADTPWTRQVLQRGEVFIGDGPAALAAAFDDHARIAALGLNCIVNVPLLSGGDAGTVVGTFNLLGTAGVWTPEQIATVRSLGRMALPALLSIVA